MRLSVLLSVILAFAGAQSVDAQAFDEEFDGGVLDECRWCACQVDQFNEPVTFPFDAADTSLRYAQIVANDFSLGGNRCRTGAPQFECPKRKECAAAELSLSAAAAAEPAIPDLPESLGPSFFEPVRPAFNTEAGIQAAPALAPLRKDPYCTDEVELRAHRQHEDDDCIQRQELRLNSKLPSGKSQLYSFRFRMPRQDELGDRANSIRWVIAQWKEEPLSERYTKAFGVDWGPSPFLALRFDDGILHVTVQDEDCRCMVASARDAQGNIGVWTPSHPAGCRDASSGPEQGAICTPKFQIHYDGNPVLSSPLGSWTELRFQVQARRAPDAKIVVWEGDHRVVTVFGKIGYEYSEDPEEPTVTKFKIGHYRDYMPFPANLDIDWLKVSDAQEQ